MVRWNRSVDPMPPSSPPTRSPPPTRTLSQSPFPSPFSSFLIPSPSVHTAAARAFLPPPLLPPSHLSSLAPPLPHFILTRRLLLLFLVQVRAAWNKVNRAIAKKGAKSMKKLFVEFDTDGGGTVRLKKSTGVPCTAHASIHSRVCAQRRRCITLRRQRQASNQHQTSLLFLKKSCCLFSERAVG